MRLLALFFFAFPVALAERGEKDRVFLACPCLDNGSCSSCDMTSCPFTGVISSISGFGDGGTGLNGIAAWSVHVNGKQYVVKFGGLETDKKKSLQAATFAHALHVVTPTQLLIDYKSCTSLWTQSTSDCFSQVPHHERESQKEAFTKDLEATRKCNPTCPKVVVQQHAGHLEVSSEIDKIERSFWYQAGAISAFEWIIGKSDLFNDLRKGQEVHNGDWEWMSRQMSEAINVNRKNIYFQKNKLVAIDLGINMLPETSAQWHLWEELLEDIPFTSSDEPLTWVKNVLFPMLLIMKANGEYGGGHHNMQAFGQFKLDDLSGWDEHLSPKLVMLGLTSTTRRALEMFSAAEKNTTFHRFLASLTGMQKTFAKCDEERMQRLSDNVDRLQRSVREEVTAREGARWTCCKVICDKQLKKFSFLRKTCSNGPNQHAWVKLGFTFRIFSGRVVNYDLQDCDDVQRDELSDEKRMGNPPGKLSQELRKYCNCKHDSTNFLVKGVEDALQSSCGQRQ